MYAHTETCLEIYLDECTLTTFINTYTRIHTTATNDVIHPGLRNVFSYSDKHKGTHKRTNEHKHTQVHTHKYTYIHSLTRTRTQTLLET